MSESASPTAEVALVSLTKRYADVLAVDDVSLEIEHGEFVSLLGPSGCGKTTTLRMIAGFIEPTAGDVRVGGRSQIGIPPHRRDTAMVFQDYALFPHKTVAQNLAFGLRMRRAVRPEIERKIGEMLTLLGLEGVESRRPSQLSGGQQQRIALGRALIIEPAVLLLDEPLGALDLKLRKQMQIELKRIQRRVGITFVYVTHDQEEALTMSDRIAVMNAGRVEQYDRPEAIYHSPGTPFVADFIGEANILAGTVVNADAEITVRERTTGELLRGTPSNGSRPQVGASATVVVRPEKVRLLEAGEAADNVLNGKLREIIFAGSAVRALVELPDGSDFQIRADRPPALDPSQQVRFGWDKRDAVVLEAQPAVNDERSRDA